MNSYCIQRRSQQAIYQNLGALLSLFSICCMRTPSHPSITLRTPNTPPSHALKPYTSLSSLLARVASFSTAALPFASSNLSRSFSLSISCIFTLSKLMLWQLRSELYLAASNCSSSACSVDRWSSMMRSSLLFSSSRCIALASLAFSPCCASASSSAISCLSLLSSSISASFLASSRWYSLSRVSSRFSLTFNSHSSSSLSWMTQARFLWRRAMSSMALSSATSRLWMRSTEDSIRLSANYSCSLFSTCICYERIRIIMINRPSQHCPRICILPLMQVGMIKTDALALRFLH